MTLRLGPGIIACLFDLDGVLTRTATVHAAAWRQLFDELLARRRAAGATGDLRPFDVEHDYLAHVDGRRRRDGVRCFLESRGIVLPDDGPGDALGDSVESLAVRKDAMFRERVDADGVDVVADSVDFVQRLTAAGIRSAVVSSSANARPVLERGGLIDRFELVVDGLVAAQHDLAGKPAPDTFRFAAREMGVEPARAAVVEDAVSGVAAGAAGGFGLVIGIGEGDHAAALVAAGATFAVASLAAVAIDLDGRPGP